MLPHQDGSSHRWLPALDQDLDLTVTLDDATSEIYSVAPLRADQRGRRWEPGALVDEEGAMSTFQALAEVIAVQGLPCALYADRASQ